jgi:ribosome-associated protein
VIRINAEIALEDREIEESFLRSPGPGGQNVNKLETAVQLRFDVRHSPSLPEPVRRRLERLAGRRLTGEGVLVLTAHRHRTRERNRADALERLIGLIRDAAVPPVPRRPTRPTTASKRRRLEAKKHHGRNKQLRRQIEE